MAALNQPDSAYRDPHPLAPPAPRHEKLRLSIHFYRSCFPSLPPSLYFPSLFCLSVCLSVSLSLSLSLCRSPVFPRSLGIFYRHTGRASRFPTVIRSGKSEMENIVEIVQRWRITRVNHLSAGYSSGIIRFRVTFYSPNRPSFSL